MNYLLIYMRRIDCIYKLELQEPEDVTDLLDPNKNWVEMFADQFFKNLK